MKAVVYDRYGPPEVLRITDVENPVPKEDEALIKVHAVSINGSDREGLLGKPLYARMGGLRRPGHRILGSDIAGRVEAVGKSHTEFKPGDEVFGEIPGYRGGLAEYVCTKGNTMALKPPSLSFDAAAAIPQAGTIAWRAICGTGQLQAGQKVLINGAGGSAGSFATQLAKLCGAEVTGVDNTRKLDFILSLGADQVIDHTEKDFTNIGKQYDLILDFIAHRSVFACQRAVAPSGTYFFVGGSIGVLIQILVLGPLVRRVRRRSVRLLVVPQNRQDLLSITELCAAGRIVPFIDRRYLLIEAPEAFRYVVEGNAKGKVVISLDNESSAESD